MYEYAEEKICKTEIQLPKYIKISPKTAKKYAKRKCNFRNA